MAGFFVDMLLNILCLMLPSLLGGLFDQAIALRNRRRWGAPQQWPGDDA
jgi:hypothetical protein